MAECPTNATDCLLRAILETNSGFNWNPLNFAFTAVLSILALFVTIAALIQNFLVAGPGRLKASKSALGPSYGTTARTSFDWAELRFRTTVLVPVIDSQQIMALVLNDSSFNVSSSYQSKFSSLMKQLGWRKTIDYDIRRYSSESDHSGVGSAWVRTKGIFLGLSWRNTFKIRKVDSEESDEREVLKFDSTSSWGKLLQDLDLEGLAFQRALCKTDYLPDDIQAAPAFATIESLVILSILAGGDSYYIDDNLPVVTGPNLQLEIRRHAVLGLIATYQRYGTDSLMLSPTGKEVLWLSQTEKVAWACSQAFGHLSYKREQLLRFDYQPSRARGIVPYFESLIQDIVNRLSEDETCSHKTCRKRRNIIPSWEEFFKEHCNYSLGFVVCWLFADRPWPGLLFPYEIACGGLQSVTKLRRNSSHSPILQVPSPWTERPSSVLRALKNSPVPGCSLLVFRETDQRKLVIINKEYTELMRHHLGPDDGEELVGELTLESWFERRHEGKFRPKNFGTLRLHPETTVSGRRADRPVILEPAHGDVLISLDALDACFRWLDDQDKPSEQQLEWLIYQLEELDWWLGFQREQVSLCAALNLLWRFSGLQQRLIEDKNNRGVSGQSLVIQKAPRLDWLFKSSDELKAPPKISSKEEGQEEVTRASATVRQSEGNDFSLSDTDSVDQKQQKSKSGTTEPTELGTTLSSEEVRPTDGFQGKGEEKKDNGAVSTIQGKKDVSRLDAMETLLLYRAFLFLTILGSGTDTSELLKARFRGRMVRVS